MKNCDKCEHYFGLPTIGSPCEKCIMEKWGNGFRKASIPTRIRILEHRLRKLVKR